MMSAGVIIWFLLLAVHVVVNHGKGMFVDHTTGYEFPSAIPEYPVRLDFDSGRPVSRGRFELLGGLNASVVRDRVPFDEFRKLLQCAPFEPSLFERFEVLKLVPYTKESLKIMCVRLENRCEPWSQCHDKLSAYENGKGESRLESDFLTSPSQGRLLRIFNNTLYVDFPWKIERFVRASRNIVDPINLILSMTSIPDAVWFHAEEFLMDKFTSVLPSFAYSAAVKSGSMPWPWAADVTKETQLYDHLSGKKKFTDTFGFGGVAGPEHLVREHWHRRRSMAAFYGTMTGVRELIYDMANTHPDEIYAVWNIIDNDDVSAWNPLSTEQSATNYVDESGDILDPSLAREVSSRPPPAGYLQGYLRNKRVESGVHYFLKFKYTLVLVGNGGFATADRLGWLLAHSGSVVMLQASEEFRYSFSPRLKPYVHYVPITYTGADIAEKVKWLRSNDDLALRIVENARNFGKSYLRLEDHYCYMATALREVGRLCEGSDVTEPFGAGSTYMIDLSSSA